MSQKLRSFGIGGDIKEQLIEANGRIEGNGRLKGLDYKELGKAVGLNETRVHNQFNLMLARYLGAVSKQLREDIKEAAFRVITSGVENSRDVYKQVKQALHGQLTPDVFYKRTVQNCIQEALRLQLYRE